MEIWKLMLAIMLYGAIDGTASADVYTYVGQDQVVVLTNLKPQNQRAEVLVAEDAARLPAATRAVSAARRRTEFDDIIDSAASAFSIDGALLHAVISVESNYAATARSPKGALGLMQLMPDTAKAFGVTDPFDPAQNINGGARYLKYLLDKYGDRLDIALSAYNAGERALARHGGKVPPFGETLRYLDLVRARYATLRREGSSVPAAK
ncbi:lytic transglycosylase domain-containing protein [Telluria sp. Tellsp104]